MVATQKRFYREGAKFAKKDGEKSARRKRQFRTLSGQPTVSAASARVVYEQVMPDGTDISTIIIFFFLNSPLPLEIKK